MHPEHILVGMDGEVIIPINLMLSPAQLRSLTLATIGAFEFAQGFPNYRNATQALVSAGDLYAVLKQLATIDGEIMHYLEHSAIVAGGKK